MPRKNERDPENRDPILREVFRKMGGGKEHGGQAALHAALLQRKRTISKMAISRWVRIPDGYVRDVYELTDIPMSRLRPDLYGFLSRGSKETAAAA